MIDNIFFVLTLLTALGCGLVAGILFIFSNTVMSALAGLQPPQGIAAMQGINRIILNPLFFVVFLGTGVTSILLAVSLLWRWHQDVREGKFMRRNGTIYLLDRMRLPAMWWDFRKAYPVKWTGPELLADSNAVALESVELAHQGIVKPEENTYLAITRGAISVGSQLF